MSDSESEEENHIRYGTPLDAYDEDDVPSKKKPGHVVSEQFAYDDQGKRRFHGAFTGGFTAGYGNTVAAPEGWAPATFRSTRSEKAQSNFQKPEDFMDDEDRGQFGIAPKEIGTTKDFASKKRKHQRNELQDGPIPGVPVLQTLLQPAHDSVAIRILKSMGWRLGQGIGERLTAKEKQKQNKSNKKVYSCQIPKEFLPPRTSGAEDDIQPESDAESSEEEYSDVLFAPDDYEPYFQKPKNDLFGLGYEGMSRRSVLGSITGRYGEESGSGSRSHLLMQDKGKKVSIRGQAFGVGALEEDDEDIYAREDMSNYDFILGGDTKQKDKPKSSEKKGSRHNLDGFVAATIPSGQKKAYPPPVLPRDYKPGIGGVRKSRFEPVVAGNVQTRDRGLGRHDLTATERGKLWTETTNQTENVVPGWKKDSANTSTAKKQTPEELIAAITGRNINFTTNVDDDNSDKKLSNNDKDTSENNTDSNVFKPFASNPDKQSRYEKFLRDKDGVSSDDVNVPSGKLQQWEREREIKEFEQASRLYRPLAGTMGDRFVRPSDAEGASIDPMASIARSQFRCGVTQEQIDAAASKMYGKLTRSEKQWRPESLLCKRFNIPDPFGQRSNEMTASKKKSQYSIFEFLETPLHNKESFLRDQAAFSGANSASAVHSKPGEHGANNSVSVEKSNIEYTISKDASVDVEETAEIAVYASVGKNKRLTVAELFLMEKEKEKGVKMQRNSEPVTEESTHAAEAEMKDDFVEDAIEKFDKIDLYKAIFLSDSDSDVKAEEKPTDVAKVKDVHTLPLNLERNESPPRGIFANLDFDHLNSWRTRNAEVKDVRQTTPQPETIANAVVNDGAESYGPKLPDKHIFKPKFGAKLPNDAVSADSSSSSDSWVDSNEASKMKEKVAKHRKGKKAHKERHRRHKRKGKSKKHTR